MSEKPRLFPYKPTHEIMLVGCDDWTVIQIALDGHEVSLLEEIVDLINATAEDGCQPRMYITENK